MGKQWPIRIGPVPEEQGTCDGPKSHEGPKHSKKLKLYQQEKIKESNSCYMDN